VSDSKGRQKHGKRVDERGRRRKGMRTREGEEEKEAAKKNVH